MRRIGPGLPERSGERQAPLGADTPVGSADGEEHCPPRQCGRLWHQIERGGGRLLPDRLKLAQDAPVDHRRQRCDGIDRRLTQRQTQRGVRTARHATQHQRPRREHLPRTPDARQRPVAPGGERVIALCDMLRQPVDAARAAVAPVTVAR